MAGESTASSYPGGALRGTLTKRRRTVQVLRLPSRQHRSRRSAMELPDGFPDSVAGNIVGHTTIMPCFSSPSSPHWPRQLPEGFQNLRPTIISPPFQRTPDVMLHAAARPSRAARICPVPLRSRARSAGHLSVPEGSVPEYAFPSCSIAAIPSTEH